MTHGRQIAGACTPLFGRCTHRWRGAPSPPQTGDPHDDLLPRLEDAFGHRELQDAWSAGTRADPVELTAQV